MAFLWGLCEGLFFFLVPDIWLTHLSIQSAKRAVIGALWVVFGSLTAAALLFVALHFGGDPLYQRLQQFWHHLPGFRYPMVATADDFLRAKGARGFLLGPSSGLPYRVFVLEAWKLGIPLSSILLWTPFARLQRILLVPVLFLLLRFGLERTPMRRNTRVRLLYAGMLIYWVALYFWYWGYFLPVKYG